MIKDAYLIIAHNNFEILKKLIKSLDYINNDIYVHIDKKVKDINYDKFIKEVKYSNVYFIQNRINVNWGGKSQIDVEMVLLEAAIKKKYRYYHLISGVDFIIKSSEYIYKFFGENINKEFIGVSNYNKENIEDRLKYYYIFRDISFVKRNKIVNKAISILDMISVSIQKLIGINRLKNNDINIYKGCNWFSITHNCAEYIYSQKKLIDRMYKYSYCCDEIFLQTLIMNSRFRYNLYDNKKEFNGCKREIDWNRGKPYIFKNKDLKYLLKSDMIFARKFDWNIDKDIVLSLEKEVTIYK